LLNKIATATHRLMNYSIFATVCTGILTLSLLWLIAALQESDTGMAHDLKKIDVKQFHDLFIWMLIVLVAIHVVAALYHQLVLRDNILRRMAIKRFPD
jgi:cytochrome b561